MNLSIYARDKWIIKSDYLSEPDTVLIFRPNTYSSNSICPLVYLLHGYSQNYKQWPEITDLQKLSNQYGAIIVCPDGFTSFYTNSPIDASIRYEDFFFKDLAPRIHKTFRIDSRNVFISGLSMGGYGALRLLILYPDYFNTAASTSGALALDFTGFHNISQHFWQSGRLVADTRKIFGKPDNNNWRQYSITSLLAKHKDIQKTFLIDCGTDDILYQATIELKALADNLNIPITFIAQPGDHDTGYWNKSVEQHFLYFRQHLKR